ncbi:MAG: ATP phosphoribosyltransferase regulatory subunit [Halothiobacillaceae bacterium]|nr:ATP phosphoribosyltransferase regulatory subunit [Halothiobacillaceae bacterium]HER34520.1 ATP phosphoribosyltransferase regulatory subunit [Halothiobacillaceae bacterium]
MSNQSPWILPAGIDEVLPSQARRIERVRTRMLDTFDRWGYELVVPPMVEFIDTLLVGTGADLDLDTLKVTDGLSGRQLGVRADMTPQVARMDAHSLPPVEERRLCYIGTVIRAKTDGLGGSRAPMQVGAELFGSDAPEADVEVISLMTEALAVGGCRQMTLDLGHVGVFRSLVRAAGLDEAREDQLRDALTRKAVPEIRETLAGWSLGKRITGAIEALCSLHGPWKETLAKANRLLVDLLDGEGQAALERLATVAEAIQARVTGEVLVDLSELHGYHYQTGLVYAAYSPRMGREIARGGRYDDIGRVFGRSRPALGFSLDLRELLDGEDDAASRQTVYAPSRLNDEALDRAVADWRGRGYRVITTNSIPDGAPQLVAVDDGQTQTWQLTGELDHG